MFIRMLTGLLAVATLLGLVPSFAGADAQSVPVSILADEAIDAEIWMAVDATDAELAAVEQRIRTSRDVRRYARVTKEDAYTEFSRIFAKNPDLVHSITANDLPPQFRVDLRRTIDATKWGDQIRVMAGVDHVDSNRGLSKPAALTRIRECQALGDADLEVFMQVDATQAQFEAAMTAAGGEPGLTITHVLNKDDAYKTFKKIYRNRPDLVRSITPSDLPMSFRMQAVQPLTPETLERLEALDGVDTVETPSSKCKSILALLAGGATPKELARLLAK